MDETKKLRTKVKELQAEIKLLRSQLNAQIPSQKLIDEFADKEFFNDIYLQSANMGIWDFNSVTGKARINPELCQILEIAESINTLDTKELDGYIYEEDYADVLNVRKLHIQKKTKFFEADYRIKTEKGNTKWIHSRGRIVKFDTNNNPLRILGFTIDITYLKEIEERLHFEQEKYKSLFLNAPLGAFKSTLDGKLLEINPEFARIFGYSDVQSAQNEITHIGEKLYVDPKERERLIDSTRKKKGIHINEINFKKKDGTHFIGRVIVRFISSSDGDTFLEGHIEDITETKRIFEVLIKSEEKFNQLANNISDVFWIIDANDKLIYINSAFENVFGRKIEEIVESTGEWLKWIYPEDQQRVFDIYEKRLYENGPTNDYYRIVKPDGQIRWIWARNFPVYDNEGKFYRVVGILSDVTEQKLLENALLQSNKKVSLLLEQTPLAYIEWNKNFEITGWNDASTDIFKFSKEEVLGASILDILVPSYNKDYFTHLLGDLIDQKVSTKTTNENIDKDGNIIICDWYNNALIDSDGELIGLVSMVQDITARITAEKEVAYSHNFFNTTFNAIPDYIHVLDENLNLFFVNQAFQEFVKELGLPIIKKNDNIKEVFPFLKAKVFREYRQVFNSGKELNTEEYTKIKGDIIYTESRKTPIFEDGRVKYIVTTVRNITNRVNTEKALRESEKRLKLAFDAANDGLWDFNPKTKDIYYFSPRWFTMLGYDPDELATEYETWYDLLHPDERLDVENKLWDFANNKLDVFAYEFRMKTKSGDYKWILSRGDLVEFDEDGFPIRMVGTHVDITENKRILELLKNKEKQLRTLLEYSDDSILVLSQDGIINFAGRLEEQITGKKLQKIIGTSYFNLLSKENEKKFKAALNKVISQPKKKISIEYEIITAGGDPYFLEGIFLNHINTVGIDGIVINIRNVTEKKIGELEREELQRNQNLLSETAIEFLKLRDFESVYKFIGEKLQKLIGDPIIFIGVYKKTKKIENRYSIGIEKYLDKIRENIGEDHLGFSVELDDKRIEYLKSRQLFEISGGISELTLNQLPITICKNLEKILEVDKIFLIGLTSGDDLLGSVVILTKKSDNLTYSKVLETLMNQASIAIDRLMLESELKKSKEKAEAADHLKSAFLANMSHEIRTPMNAILGFSDLLNDNNLDTKIREEYIEIINNQGNHLLHLINDIVDISKIESGQIKIIESKSNLNHILNKIHQLFEQEIEVKSKGKVKLICENQIKDADSNLFIDETRLIQIFSNLIHNAIKFTKKGHIKFGYTLKNEFIEFFVKDTGVGFPSDLKKIIFDRFQQVDNTKIKKYGGAGLGLAICRGILKQMNGEIWGESTIGKGSSFYFNIPYKPASDNIIPKKVNLNYKEKYNWDGKKILLVEDDEPSLLYLNAILKETGIEIIEAKTGKNALEKFRKNQDIDIILIDIQLPEISGTYVCEEIRKINTKVKIIVQTAYAMPGDEKICLKAGADDYITKPVKMTILKPLINYHLFS